MIGIPQLLKSGVHWLVAGIEFAAASYGVYVAAAWYRYGHPTHTTNPGGADSLLDRFIPVYEVVERHQVRVAAPAETTFSAACNMDLQQSPVVRAIFKGRQLILGAQPESKSVPLGLEAQAKAWGWGVLAGVPGQEIIFGAATQPWVPNPVFRALPPDEFRDFAEPGYVKIAWTLRADRIDKTRSIFRTETRVVSTDPVSRAKFCRYWALLSPGIILIRWASLGPLRAEAERQARQEHLSEVDR